MSAATFLTNRPSSVIHKPKTMTSFSTEVVKSTYRLAIDVHLKSGSVQSVVGGLRDVFKSGDDPITGLRCCPIMMT